MNNDILSKQECIDYCNIIYSGYLYAIKIKTDISFGYGLSNKQTSQLVDLMVNEHVGEKLQ